MTKIVSALLAVCALLAGSVAVGRWEGHRETQRIRSGILRARALAPRNLDARANSSYRYEQGWTCLLYRSGGKVLGVELCFDGNGRLIEAIDRRGAQPHFFSFNYDAALSPIRVPLASVDRTIADFNRRAAVQLRANELIPIYKGCAALALKMQRRLRVGVPSPALVEASITGCRGAEPILRAPLPPGSFPVDRLGRGFLTAAPVLAAAADAIPGNSKPPLSAFAPVGPAMAQVLATAPKAERILTHVIDVIGPIEPPS